MGYSTYFTDSFTLNKPADEATRKLIEDICEDPENAPDSAEVRGVGFYCQWSLSEDGKAIEHDGGEKFYGYIEWATYLHKLLASRGYEMTGNVKWSGEDAEDIGTIVATPEKIQVIFGERTEHQVSTVEVMERILAALIEAKLNFENGKGMPSSLLEAIELATTHSK